MERECLTSTSMIKTWKGLGVVAGGLIGISLTFGTLATSQQVDIWQKKGQTLYTTPSSLAVDLASTTSDLLKVTDAGTQIDNLLVGTCNMVGMDVTQTATTTSAYDCAVTGVVAGDIVLANFPTTTPSTNLGWHLLGVNASSTAGYITFLVQNLTGADAVPSASAVGSSTPYMVISTP